MHIALLGASGGCGTAFLSLALARGHTVKALLRKPGKVAEQAGLEKIEGDATVAADMLKVAAGADVVVSCLGSSDSAPIMVDV